MLEVLLTPPTGTDVPGCLLPVSCQVCLIGSSIRGLLIPSTGRLSFPVLEFAVLFVSLFSPRLINATFYFALHYTDLHYMSLSLFLNLGLILYSLINLSLYYLEYCVWSPLYVHTLSQYVTYGGSSGRFPEIGM